MVGRPSIFSSDYKDRIKKRKVRNIFILLIFVVILVAILLLSRVNFSKIAQDLSNPVKKQTNSIPSVKPGNSSTADKNDAKASDKTNVKTSDDTDVKGYTVKLSNGQVLKVVYEGDNADKKFKYISPDIGSDFYQISPSGNGIIIYDKTSQGLTYVKIDGTISDISMKQYIASDKSVFQRTEELKKNPSYIWCNSPKFIDDANIAYISQLPWFKGDTIKYIWTFNVNKLNSYKVFESLTGDSVTIGTVTPGKGISIQYDGNTSFLSADGNITK